MDLSLLRPLRALADNWDIDLAHELSEYVDLVDRLSQSADLEHLLPTEDQVNFAQAALLIQNSASIYSRKVQYLFNLTQETHSYIFHQHRHDSKHSSGNGNADKNTLDDIENEYQILDTLIQQIPQPKDKCTFESAPLLLKPNLLIGGAGGSSRPFGRELFSINGDSIGFQFEFDLHSSSIGDGGALVSTFLNAFNHSLSQQPSAPIHPPPIPTTCSNTLDTAALQSDHDFEAPLDNDYSHNSMSDNDVDGILHVSVAQPVSSQPSARKSIRIDDYWLALDPHEDSGDSKPFRKANIDKTFKSTSKRVERKTKNYDNLIPIFDFRYLNSRKKLLSKIPNDKMKYLIHEEFAELYLEKLNLSKASKKKQSSKPLPEIGDEENHEEILERLADPFSFTHEDDIASSTHEDIPLNGDFHPRNSVKDDDDNDNFVQSLELLVPDEYLADDDLAQRRKPDIQKMDQKVANSVRKWEERILPLLEQQKSQVAFDIDNYRHAVQKSLQVNSNKLKSQKVSFDMFTKNIPKFEVSRYFLAALHLANEGTVSIEKGDAFGMWLRII